MQCQQVLRTQWSFKFSLRQKEGAHSYQLAGWPGTNHFPSLSRSRTTYEMRLMGKDACPCFQLASFP